MIQVNELLRDKLAHIFSIRLEIPVEFFVTVTRIVASNDLRNATVWLSILPNNKAREGMAWIVNHRKEAQRLLGKETRRMKNTPVLLFKHDDQEVRSHEIYDLIDESEGNAENSKLQFSNKSQN